VIYSGLSKTPLLVVEKISRHSLMMAQAVKREDNFFPDTRAKRRDRANLHDYKGSGFDRGHMAAAANRASDRAMRQSFALTNMVPQDPTSNRKTWNKLERDTRRYAKRAKGDVFVFSGPLFESPTAVTIGKSRVWVPSHLFKLVVDLEAKKSWAHLVSNDNTAYRGPPLTYDQFVSRTGWDVLPEP
jgi:endonuclease G